MEYVENLVTLRDTLYIYIFFQAGCTLKFMVDWAWGRVAAIKQRLDASLTPLFDLSLAEADERTRTLVSQLSGQLAQLVSILAAVSAAAGLITQVTHLLKTNLLLAIAICSVVLRIALQYIIRYMLNKQCNITIRLCQVGSYIGR